MIYFKLLIIEKLLIKARNVETSNQPKLDCIGNSLVIAKPNLSKATIDRLIAEMIVHDLEPYKLVDRIGKLIRK